MADTTKYLGVSQPISIAGPDEQDVKLTFMLEDCLQSKNLFENEQEMQKRIDVLTRVSNHVKEFVKIATRAGNKLQEGEEPVNYGGKLFTFGSYRLGVHNRGADIDTLCVAPRNVSRDDFFKHFFNLLQNDPEVKELHAVPEAFVPVIKLVYSGIELDILFARLALKEIPDDQSLLDDNLLKNLDQASIRSLNGSRVAHEILNLIPSQDTYVTVLRAIKYWATIQGVYSNVLGYFGGVTWAILAARVCQLYPRASPAKLLQKFFYVFKQWSWPQPVCLKDIGVSGNEISQFCTDMVWDPRTRIADRLHLMPIITPAYPEQNSTFNVTMSNKKVIMAALEEASIITDEIYLGKSTWDKLFEPVNFFTKYKHFIAVLCCAKTEQDHVNYVGFVQSRLRLLTAGLERHEAIQCAQVCTKQYTPISLEGFPKIEYENPVACIWFLGLELDPNLAKTLDLTTEITSFMNTVQQMQQNSKTKYTDGQTVELTYIHQKKIKVLLSAADLTAGRRYQKRKPLVRTASDAGVAGANGEPEAKIMKPTVDEVATESITEENAKKETTDVIDGVLKEESPAKPVFSFGAETQNTEKTENKMEVDNSAKDKVLQESFSSLPKIEISSDKELEKVCPQIGMKRSRSDEEDAPPEKQPRNVTVA